MTSFNSDFNSMRTRHSIMEKIIFGWILTVFVLVLGSIIANVSMNVSGKSGERANREARNWASAMYPNETTQIVCQNIDTDANGYISCTVRVGTQPPMGIECATPISMNNGCRIPILQNLRQR